MDLKEIDQGKNMPWCVIATMGMTPPPVTEFLDYLAFEKGKEISKLVVIETSSESVKQNTEVVRVALKHKKREGVEKYLRTKFERISLPFDDISTEEDNLSFLETCSAVIRKEKMDNNGKVLLNVSGGRKNMCITLSMLGAIMNVRGVYHVVSEDPGINIELEQVRPIIKEIYEAEDEEEKLRIYEENSDVLNRVLFQRKGIRVLRIPTLPYPDEWISNLRETLSSRRISGLGSNEVELLELHGVLKRRGRTERSRSIRLTDFGETLRRVFSG